MSSLAGSVGRVSLAFQSSAVPCRSRQQRPCRRSRSSCASPPTTASAKDPSEGSRGDRLLGFGRSANDAPGGLGFQDRSGLRSLLSVVVAVALTIGIQGAPLSRDTFEDVPQSLSGGDTGHRIQKPKSVKAESCTRKCVSTCIRGGAGAPGEGPLNVRRPLVVFKEGFRSRNYCLVECSEICNLIGDGDDGP